MKYHEYRDLFRKKMAVVGLCVGTALCMTACSFSFENTLQDDSIYYEQEILPVSANDMNNVGSMIENCDLTSEDEISQLQSDISEWANDVENVSCYSFVECTLVRVVDGDTIVVNINNEEYTVRMIGIDTPESVAPESYLEQSGKENTQEGVDASNYTRELLSNYEVLYLEQDVSDTDRYDRLLRYVWLEIPTDCNNIDEIRTKMLNGILLDEGIAVISTYQPDIKYVDYFAEINSYDAHSVDEVDEIEMDY